MGNNEGGQESDRVTSIVALSLLMPLSMTVGGFFGMLSWYNGEWGVDQFVYLAMGLLATMLWPFVISMALWGVFVIVIGRFSLLGAVIGGVVNIGGIFGLAYAGLARFIF